MPLIMTILGTRPEIIRLSETIKKLDTYTDHCLVFTAQSYDYEMSQIFFDELGIRKPNYTLDVKADSVGKQIGNILSQCEEVMVKEKPDAVLILGDTNSALSCIIAKRMQIPVFHMEAGNRCWDERVPEEVNRRIVDHTSDVSLCYTEHARRNLLREGTAPQNIFVVGSPLAEVYSLHRKRATESQVLRTLSLKRNGYLLASLHREENVKDDASLRLLFMTLCRLGAIYEMPVVFSAHPRTRRRLDELHVGYDGILVHEPFGMLDYICLQINAFCNLSDSGTIHEDAAILGIPAVNLREGHERPEVYDTGNVVISGVDPDAIVEAVSLVKRQGLSADIPPEYRVGDCSDRVARIITGYWRIIREKKYRDSSSFARLQRGTVYQEHGD